MIHDTQPMIDNRFLDMNGNLWPEHFIAAYNSYTCDINKSANVPIDSDSLTQKERDGFLDRRHQYFVYVTEILNNKGD